MPPIPLTAEDRDQIHATLADLAGKQRQREYARVRFKVLCIRPDFRQANNVVAAARGRAAYHADRDESRRKGAEK